MVLKQDRVNDIRKKQAEKFGANYASAEATAFEIKKDGTILRFLSTAGTEDEFKIFDPIFQKMMSSLKF